MKAKFLCIKVENEVEISMALVDKACARDGGLVRKERLKGFIDRLEEGAMPFDTYKSILPLLFKER